MTFDHCYQPWLEMQIQYDKTIGCCCYYHGEKPKWDYEKQARLNIAAYWNGAFMQRLRRIIRNNDARGTGCSGCQFVQYGIAELSALPPAFMNTQQSANYQAALEHFRNKDLVVESLPVRYYLNFGLACNLQCIMCSQAEMRQTHKKKLPAELFDDLKGAFQSAEQVAVIGGEPFAMAEAREFIQQFNECADLLNVRLCLFTNGTLLDRYRELYRKIKRINFCISLDGIGQTYEKIRKGASWGRIEENIQQVRKMGSRMDRDWTVTIASVLMKSSLGDLVPYARWCIDNQVACHFVPIVSSTLDNGEDIFRYPQLLDEVPNWERDLDASIDILSRAEWGNGAADCLQKMKKVLHDKYAMYKANPILFAIHDVKTLFEDLRKSKYGKFMIWGTGSFYEINFSAFIKSINGSCFLGFVDNDPKKWGHLIEGKQIFNPEELRKINPDLILIASAMRQEIVDQIRILNLASCIVI